MALSLTPLFAGATMLAAQTGVAGASTQSATVIQRADALIRDSRTSEAAELLGSWLAEHANDGRAWFYLGRLHLTDAQSWHRQAHLGEKTGAQLLGFAGAAFEQSQQLLTDSGGVFRVMVATEQATLRIEKGGWAAIDSLVLPDEDLPLPPVLAELGANLLASCPLRGVLVTGSFAETTSAWGARLLNGTRPDLILVRPDLYRADGRYRARMAAALGTDSASDLAGALAVAGASRPICLAPSVDSLPVAGMSWHAERLVLVSGAPRAADSTQLAVYHFGRTGLAGSVWTAAARDTYDLAARRNAALCKSLFADSEARGLPAIASCPR